MSFLAPPLYIKLDQNVKKLETASQEVLDIELSVDMNQASEWDNK